MDMTKSDYMVIWSNAYSSFYNGATESDKQYTATLNINATDYADKMIETILEKTRNMKFLDSVKPTKKKVSNTEINFN